MTVAVCRYVIEALITQVVELNKQLDEHMAGTLIDGMESLDIEDSNDGAFLCIADNSLAYSVSPL